MCTSKMWIKEEGGEIIFQKKYKMLIDYLIDWLIDFILDLILDYWRNEYTMVSAYNGTLPLFSFQHLSVQGKQIKSDVYNISPT